MTSSDTADPVGTVSRTHDDRGADLQWDLSGSRRLDIQGLRAVAVLAVVAFHAGLPLPGGFMGVDIFFVISGFVITRLMLRRAVAEGKFELGVFWYRRFWRLMPALALTVGATIGLGFFLLSPIGEQRVAASTGLGALLLCANLVISRFSGDYFRNEVETNPLLNTWSLSVEEQFYVAVPLVLAGITLSRLLRRRWFFSSTVAVLTAGSFALCLASSYRTPGTLQWLPSWIDPQFAFYSPLTRAWEFGVGAVVAAEWRRVAGIPGRALEVLGAVGAALLVLTLLFYSPDVAFPGVVVLVPVLGTAALLLAGAVPNPVSRLIGTSAPVAIGDMSYSLYLWHWPLIVYVGMATGGAAWAPLVGALLAFIVASLSYRFVEQKLRHRSPRGRGADIRAVLVVVIVPAVLAVLMIIGSGNAWWSGQGSLFARQVTASFPAESCPEATAINEAGDRVCTWNSDAQGAPIYGIGDSSLWQVSQELVDASTTLGRPLHILAHPACVAGTLRQGWVENGQFSGEVGCSRFTESAMEFLRTAPPGTLVASAVDYYPYTSSIGFIDDAGQVVEGVDGKARQVELGLTRLAEAAKDGGHNVLFLQSPAAFYDDFPAANRPWSPYRCTGIGFLDPERWCGRDIDASSFVAGRAEMRSAVDRAAASVGGRTFDPMAYLCGASCSTSRDGAWMYRDGSHLSVEGAKTLAVPLLNAIASMAP